MHSIIDGDIISEQNKFNTWMDEDGVYHVVTIDNITIDIDDLKNEFQRYKLEIKNFSPPVLVDITRVSSITSNGRKYIAEELAKSGIPATALLVKSRISQLLGSFFIGINKPEFPVRLFDNEQDALKWLKGFLDD